jgi:hypothetical protein
MNTQSNQAALETLNETERWVHSGFAESLIPLEAGSKVTFEKGWNGNEYSAEDLYQRVKYDGANIGLRLSSYTAIDVEDSPLGDSIAALVREKFPDAPCRSRPGSPSKAFLLATDGPVASWCIPRPDDVPGAGHLLVEALHGGQVHILGTREDKGGARLQWDGFLPAALLPVVTNDQLRQLGEDITAVLNESGVKVELSTQRRAKNGRLEADKEQRLVLSDSVLLAAVRAIPRDGYFTERNTRIAMMYAIAGAADGAEWARDIWIEWASQEHPDGPPINPDKAAKTWDRLDMDSVKAGAGLLMHHLERLGLIELRDRVVQDAGPSMFAELTDEEKAAFAQARKDRQPYTQHDDDEFYGVWFDGDAPPEPVACIVEDMIPAEGLTFIGGQSGAGKTFQAIHLAVGLATAGRYCGHDIVERLGVIYVAAEGAATIAPRIAAAKRAVFIDENLPIAIIKRVPNLSDAASRLSFKARVKRVTEELRARFDVRVGAVVIDTLAAAFSIKDENSNSEMQMTCKWADEIGAHVEAATIVLHHYGKDASTGLRGASASRAAGESALAVLCDRDAVTGVVRNRRVVHEKNRAGEEGERIGFELRSMDLGSDAKGKPFAAAYVAETGIRAAGERAAEAAAVAGDDGRGDGGGDDDGDDTSVPIRVLMYLMVYPNRRVTQLEISRALNKGRSPVRRAISKLIRDKAITQDGETKQFTITKRGEQLVTNHVQKRQKREKTPCDI